MRLDRPDLLPKELSREETLKAHDFEIDRRLETIERLEKIFSPVELAHENVLNCCLLKDRMFAEFGIEPEDYNLAVTKYKLEEDENVQRR